MGFCVFTSSWSCPYTYYWRTYFILSPSPTCHTILVTRSLSVPCGRLLFILLSACGCSVSDKSSWSGPPSSRTFLQACLRQSTNTLLSMLFSYNVTVFFFSDTILKEARAMEISFANTTFKTRLTQSFAMAVWQQTRIVPDRIVEISSLFCLSCTCRGPKQSSILYVCFWTACISYYKDPHGTRPLRVAVYQNN